MRVRILPGSKVEGETGVPGDKSIAHRWLVLAATGRGTSVLRGVPAGLDVAATARALASLFPPAASTLGQWARDVVEGQDRIGDSGWDRAELRVEGQGRGSLTSPPQPIHCANSGTTMRLLAGVLAASPIEVALTGDDSLLRRPMERVAEPLRAMGARVETAEGRPPLVVEGGPLHGIRWSPVPPSAQVKGAILLAGLAAEGESEVRETIATRDHTERALEALGAPLRRDDRGVVTVSAYEHDSFEGTVPGDISSAAFPVAAAAVTGGAITVGGVGLNPSRHRFLRVMQRMGVAVEEHVREHQMGEPLGDLHARSTTGLSGTNVGVDESPLMLDEIPVVAMLAAIAEGETRFEGAGELRVKESDRLTALAEGIRDLGGVAEVNGDALIVAGGGLDGGTTDARHDHRLAMAFVVGALGAGGPSEVTGVEWANVSFPGFTRVLGALGARIEVAGDA